MWLGEEFFLSENFFVHKLSFHILSSIGWIKEFPVTAQNGEKSITFRLNHKIINKLKDAFLFSELDTFSRSCQDQANIFSVKSFSIWKIVTHICCAGKKIWWILTRTIFHLANLQLRWAEFWIKVAGKACREPTT